MAIPRSLPGIFILFASLMIIAADAHAFRCGNALVAEGDTKIDVLRACGEPDYREFIGSREIGPNTVTMEIWVYDFGPLKFTQTLTFHGHRLVRIEAGD